MGNRLVAVWAIEFGKATWDFLKGVVGVLVLIDKCSTA
jgi:hypothetical protein